MQLSQNHKIFLEFFSGLPKSAENFEYFENEDDPQRLFVFEILDCKKLGYLNV